MLLLVTGLLALFLALFTVIRNPVIQNLAVRTAAAYFSKIWETEVRISSISYDPLRGVSLADIFVRDHAGDTLFAADRISVLPDFSQLLNRNIHLRKVVVDHGNVQILTHKGDSVLNLQFIIDSFSSTDTIAQEQDTTSAGTSKWYFSGAAVDLIDTRFHYQDENAPPAPAGMDYANIDVSHINLKISTLSFEGDTINATITSLTAHERSGFNLLEFSGEFRVSPAFLKARNLAIVTPISDIRLDFSFLYENWSGYLDFIREVTIEGNIRPSILDLRDIGFFAPEVSVMNDRLNIEGKMRGTVANFKAEDFRFAFGSGTTFFGNVASIGLPDIYETYVDLEIFDFRTSVSDISSFRIPGDAGSIELPDILSKLGTISLRGRFTGYYDDFITQMSLRTGIGNVDANLTLKQPEGQKSYSYTGNILSANIQLGTLLESSTFDNISLRGSIDGSGFAAGDARVTTYVAIDTFDLNQYRYHNIVVNGTYDERSFNGSLKINDRNLHLDFNGLADFSDTIPSFDFTAVIPMADLFDLRVLERDSVEILSGRVDARFSGNSLDNLDGRIHLLQFSLREGEKEAFINDLELYTRNSDNGDKSYHVRSDIADADFTGRFRFNRLLGSLNRFVTNYLAYFNYQDSLIVTTDLVDQHMNYSVRFKNTYDITEIFLPFLRVAPGASLTGYFDERDEQFILNGNADYLSLAGTELEDWYVHAETKPDRLGLVTGCSKFYILKPSPDDSISVFLDSLSLTSSLHRDSVLYHVTWKDIPDQAFIKGFLHLPNTGSYFARIDDMNVRITKNHWTVNPENFISIDSSGIRFHKLEFLALESALSINGRISERKQDTLLLKFRNLDISEVDRLLGTENIDLNATLDGTARLADVYNRFSVLGDIRLNGLTFNDQLLGDATFKVDYLTNPDRFEMDAQVLYTGNAGTNTPIALKGSYWLGNEPHFEVDATLKNLNLKMIEPFVIDFMPRLSGLLSGQVHARGTFDDPDLSGTLNLMRTEFTVGYINVSYSLSDKITIEKDRFVFDEITLFDSLGNKAFLNGEITHKAFGNMMLDLGIEMTDFSAFQNTFAQNNLFFGNARATGNVQITGPFDNIKVSVNAANGGNTHVTIPISLTADVGQLEYIIFEQEVPDTLINLTGAGRVTPVSGFSLDLNLSVQPDAVVNVFLPDQLGNLQAQGTGDLKMTMTPTSPFLITGNYELLRGSMLLQLKNFIRLPFSIQPGSRISWSGDPADANLLVSAVYKTKVPLAGLTPDPELANIRVPVECIIRVTGKLMNPMLNFGLAMPNAEESVKTMVFNTIDTTDQSMMSQQVLYILMLNQFNPVKGGSASMNLAGTPLTLVTNQISSMFSGLSKNLSVDVNYRPATAETSSEFDVGLSTQFLDDRLLIDGTFGMMNNRNTTLEQASTIVGDINIQYAITKNRQLWVRVFNRTNTVDILDNKAPYTQGVGLSYQRNFSSLRELFSGKKKDKKKSDH